MKKIYKIIEVFPQSTVKQINYVEANTKGELRRAKENPNKYAILTKEVVDYGDEAYTESCEESCLMHCQYCGQVMIEEDFNLNLGFCDKCTEMHI